MFATGQESEQNANCTVVLRSRRKKFIWNKTINLRKSLIYDLFLPLTEAQQRNIWHCTANCKAHNVISLCNVQLIDSICLCRSLILILSLIQIVCFHFLLSVYSKNYTQIQSASVINCTLYRTLICNCVVLCWNYTPYAMLRPCKQMMTLLNS